MSFDGWLLGLGRLFFPELDSPSIVTVAIILVLLDLDGVKSLKFSASSRVSGISLPFVSGKNKTDAPFIIEMAANVDKETVICVYAV